MLLALRPDKFVDSLCKKPPGNMNELCERAKGYIQMEEMSRSQNEVRQVEQKRDKCEVNTKANLHKSNKRHKEIIIVKADQKQARQCYVESLKVAPYPHIREPAMPHPTAAKGTAVTQLGIARKMERCHEEELKKLKGYHDEFEAHVRPSQGDEHSTHTINEHTLGESHPR
ncbi:hypothetical protein JHK84_043309 [Glycine max]|nr:hypothetical protein JHK84_043309 [Glycine max]